MSTLLSLLGACFAGLVAALCMTIFELPFWKRSGMEGNGVFTMRFTTHITTLQVNFTEQATFTGIVGGSQSGSIDIHSVGTATAGMFLVPEASSVSAQLVLLHGTGGLAGIHGVGTEAGLAYTITVRQASHHSHSSAFSENITGTVSGVSPNLVVTSGTGTATHLGKVTFVISGPPTPTNGLGCSGQVTNEGNTTTASGDELFMSFTYVVCPTSPSTVQITGNFATTGTGRLANVSVFGTVGVMVVLTGPTMGTFSQTMTGTIIFR